MSIGPYVESNVSFVEACKYGIKYFGYYLLILILGMIFYGLGFAMMLIAWPIAIIFVFIGMVILMVGGFGIMFKLISDSVAGELARRKVSTAPKEKSFGEQGSPPPLREGPGSSQLDELWEPSEKEEEEKEEKESN